MLRAPFSRPPSSGTMSSARDKGVPATSGKASLMRRSLITLISLFMLLTPGARSATAQEATPSAGDLMPYAPAEAARLITLSPDGTMVAGLQKETGALCTFAVPSGETVACADLDEQRIALREDDLRWSPDSQSIIFAEKAFIYLVDGDLWRFEAKT